MANTDCSPPDPLAVQLAQILCDGSEDDLAEAVDRWIASAPSEAARQLCAELGARLKEMKHAMKELPVAPTRPELEFNLTLMLQLARGHSAAGSSR